MGNDERPPVTDYLVTCLGQIWLTEEVGTVASEAAAGRGWDGEMAPGTGQVQSMGLLHCHSVYTCSL